MGIAYETILTQDQLENGHRIYVDHLPRGRLWDAYHLNGTPNYAIASGIGAMHALVLSYFDYIRTELNPYTTTDLIDEWEKSVGLPDHCTVGRFLTIEERRGQVVYRLKKTPIVTAAQMEQMIFDLTGYQSKILPRTQAGNPAIFDSALYIYNGGVDYDLVPAYDGYSPPLTYKDRFIFDIFIDFIDTQGLDGGTDLDGTGDVSQFNFDGKDFPTIVECVINRVKPANTIAYAHYSHELYLEAIAL